MGKLGGIIGARYLCRQWQYTAGVGDWGVGGEGRVAADKITGGDQAKPMRFLTCSGQESRRGARKKKEEPTLTKNPERSPSVGLLMSLYPPFTKSCLLSTSCKHRVLPTSTSRIRGNTGACKQKRKKTLGNINTMVIQCKASTI